jgi:putative restriction endonuclease
MRQYWWVNHGQTSKHEIGGGYLWSPKQNKNGGFNQFFDFMREASPGDYVFSYADGRISHLGTVTGTVETRIKPTEFGKAGDTWSAEGWYVPISWQRLRNPVIPKKYIEELRDLLPNKYSPLKPDGNGNQVYLTRIDRALFEAVMLRAGVDLDLALAAPELAVLFGDDVVGELEDAIAQQITISPELSATQVSQLVKARRGQGLFRLNVQTIEKSCRLTNVATPYLLVASHIKPWRACDTSIERLDGNNGLLLTPHVDLLFDRGLISFNDMGDILVSTKVSRQDLVNLGLNLSVYQPRPFNPQQSSYLKYHREEVFA